MADWQKFDAAGLFPDATKALLETVGGTADAFAAALKVTGEAIGLLGDLCIDATDPQKTIIDLLISQLSALIDDTLSTGLYLYYDCAGWPIFQRRDYDFAAMTAQMDGTGNQPYAAAVGRGYGGWKARWTKSFYDLGDDERPQISSGSNVSSLVFMAGTPNISGLPTLLSAIGMLFGIQRFTELTSKILITELSAKATKGDVTVYVTEPEKLKEDSQILIGGFSLTNPQFSLIRRIDFTTGALELYDAIGASFNKGEPVALSGMEVPVKASSQAPDWSALTLEQIPPMRKMAQIVRSVIGQLEMAPGFSTLISDLGDALKEKAEQLENLADIINEVIDLITAIISLTGVKIAKIDSTTGVDGLVTALNDLGSPGLPDKSFVVGICLAGTPAGINAIAPLFGV